MSEAVLGLRVESSQVAKATDDLNKLTDAATKAERKAIDWGDKTEAAGKKAEKAAKGAKDLGDSVKKTGKDAGDAGDKLDWVGTVVDELAKGLKSTVGPAALAGAAFTAASGAAMAAFQALRPQIKTADDLLAEHEKNILRLGDAYDVVNEKQHRYASDTANTANARNESAFQGMRDIVSGQIKLIFDDVYRTIGGGSGNQGPLERVVASQFKPFESALDHLAEESRKKLPDIRAIQDEITNIAKADPKGLNSTRDLLLNMLDAVSANAVRLPELARQISEATDIVDQFNRQIDSVESKPLREELQKIFDEALNGKKGIGDVLAELNKLEQARPAFGNIISAFKSVIEAAAATSDALDRIGAKYFENSGGSPNGRRAPMLWLPDTAPTPDHRPNAEDIGAANDKRLAALARRASRAGNPYRDILKSADDRIKQMQTELDLMGKVGVAADTLRNYQELLSRATDKGRTVGEKQRQELHDRAEAMAKLEDATKKAALMQDLLFERAQLGRSSINQQIADTMRSAGLEIDFNSPIAGAIRFNEQLKESRELAGDFVSTFVDGLRNGENAFKALGDAALSVLDKIADKLLDDALNGLFSSGGGGLLSLFGLGGGGLNVFPGGGSLNSFGGLWAKGGAFPNGISGFSNTVVSRPTPFFFAKGAGVMGEAGPEGILPLRRNGAGQLGVIVANDRAANQNSPIVQLIDQRSGGTIERDDSDGVIRLIIRDEIKKSGVGSVGQFARNHAEAKKRSMIK